MGVRSFKISKSKMGKINPHKSENEFLEIGKPSVHLKISVKLLLASGKAKIVSTPQSVA